MKNIPIKAFFCLFIIFVACKQKTESQTKAPLSLPEELKNLEICTSENQTRNYEQTKLFIKQLRSDCLTNKITEDSLSKIFSKVLVNEIIPYWYGTRWSFDGHTPAPKSGEIACGYFISTTLTDMGLNMNKFQFAQQNPENEAKTFLFSENVIVLEHHKREEHIEALLKNTKEGVYFIGFGSTHVGFLLRKKENLFLIHSKYENATGVEIERATEANMFSGYRKLYLSAISNNKKLIKKWVLGEEIKVVLK